MAVRGVCWLAVAMLAVGAAASGSCDGEADDDCDERVTAGWRESDVPDAGAADDGVCEARGEVYWPLVATGAGYGRDQSWCCPDGDSACQGYCNAAGPSEVVDGDAGLESGLLVALFDDGSQCAGRTSAEGEAARHPFSVLCRNGSVACFHTTCGDDDVTCASSVEACLSTCPGESTSCSSSGFYQGCAAVDSDGVVHSSAGTVGAGVWQVAAFSTVVAALAAAPLNL